jgi:hypothetical protein
MHEEVEKYADVFPKLDWMYIGQLQFGIRTINEPAGGSRRHPVLLSRFRESCIQLREDIFGSKDGW